MARLKKNSMLNDLRGTLGKEIVFKHYRDKVVVSKYPDMNKVKPSALQVENRKRMKEATAYALSVLHNPKLKTAFEKTLQPGETVYRKAIKQYFQDRKQKT